MSEIRSGQRAPSSQQRRLKISANGSGSRVVRAAPATNLMVMPLPAALLDASNDPLGKEKQQQKHKLSASAAPFAMRTAVKPTPVSQPSKAVLPVAPGGVWRLAATIKKCITSSKAEDLHALCDLLLHIITTSPMSAPTVVSELTSEKAVDLWERVCHRFMSPEADEGSPLSTLCHVLMSHPTSRPLLLRLWWIPGVITHLTRTGASVSAASRDKEWMPRWLETVCLDDNGDLTSAAFGRQQDIHRIALYLQSTTAGVKTLQSASLSNVFVQLDHALLSKCLSLDVVTLSTTSNRWASWFGPDCVSALESVNARPPPPPTSPNTDVVVTRLPFCSAPTQALAAFLHENNHLKCLKLCNAAMLITSGATASAAAATAAAVTASSASASSIGSTTSLSASAIDLRYLMVWCKRALRMYLRDDDMVQELLALPPPPSRFALYIYTVGMQRRRQEKEEEKAEEERMLPAWVGTALAFLLLHPQQSDAAASTAKHETDMHAEVSTHFQRFVQAFQTQLRDKSKITRTNQKDMLAAVVESIAPILPSAPLTAAQDWELRKTQSPSYRSVAVDKMMAMVGLESVKREFLRIFDFVQLQRRRGVDVKRDRFHVRLVGHDGTGKSTVARHYAAFLGELSVLSGAGIDERNAQSMLDSGVEGGYVELVKEMLAKFRGGVFVVDRAGTLDPMASPTGRSIVSAIHGDLESKLGTFACAFSGTAKELDTLFGYNSRLANRVQTRWDFEDFNEPELLQLFQQLLVARDVRFKVEGGFSCLAVRIVARRLANQRGPDFGNAHAVTYLIDVILRRQAERLQRWTLNNSNSNNNVSAPPALLDRPQSPCPSHCAGSAAVTTAAAAEVPAVLVVAPAPPDLFLLTFADIVGPNPFTALETSASYKQLMGMVGLRQVKREVEQIIHAVRENYERELRGEEKADLLLNRVFLGSPGTGKTSVAELYGKIMCDLGVLSKAEFQLRGASDFIGAALGESERKTNAILSASKGCVLAIDEAYSLDPGRSSDPYRKAAIDAIVEKVQPTGDADRVVLLLGYKKPIDDMMRNANPGLARRFDWNNPIVFEDFTEDELLLILNDYLRKKAIPATVPAVLAAMDVLSRKRRLPNFGNAGEVHNVVNAAITQYMARTRENPPNNVAARQLLPQDFVNEQDKQVETIEDIFRPMLGCEAILRKLRSIHTLIQRKKAKGVEYLSSLNHNFIFSGPPGTGKSSVAALMGRVFKSLDVLASSEVVSISASQLQAEFVGQTAARVRSTFKSALGKVLFIDEAYALDPRGFSRGSFMKEATDEIVSILTEAEFKGKLVVVMAGYPREMHQMLSGNPGLASRFPDEIVFPTFTVDDSLQLLRTILVDKQYDVDASLLQDKLIRAHMAEIAAMDAFASGRDVHTIAARIEMDLASCIDEVAKDDTAQDDHHSEHIPSIAILSALQTFLAGVQARSADSPASSVSSSSLDSLPSLVQYESDRIQAPRINIAVNRNLAHKAAAASDTASESDSSEDEDEESKDADSVDDGVDDAESSRDAGVSDETWARLQVGIRQLKEKTAEEHREQRRLEAAVRALQQQLKEALERGEQERIRKVRADMELEKARLQRIRDDTQKQKDVQAALRAMSGGCEGGYAWVRQGNGYRCSYGSCYITDEQLARDASD